MSTSIHQEVTFKAGPERIYEALMDSRQHAEFTGGGATEISPEVGGAFTAHGGGIVGRTIELVPNRRIVQAWRVANWEDGVYSLVKFELTGDGDGTRLVMDHWGFPEGLHDHLAGGWQARYWDLLGPYVEGR